MRFFDGSQVSCSGSPIKVIYSPVVNDDGTIDLLPSGKENLQEYIDSFAAEADINVIIAKFAAGDFSVLNQKQGAYGDFTQFPKTYAEMLQLQINSTNYFNSLPVSVKEKFNNDPNQFFAQTGSKEWFDIMSILYPDAKNDYGSDVDFIEKGEVKE